jgi:N,N-dimethylformamidase
MVSALVSTYDAQVVRLIHGDTNPDGPGFKELAVPTPIDGTYPGREQHLARGSYVLVEDHANELAFKTALELRTWLYPSAPTVGAQGILTRWDAATQAGYALILGQNGALTLWVGDGTRTREYSMTTPLLPFTWYDVQATLDGSAGVVEIRQEPLKPWPLGLTGETTTHALVFPPSTVRVPFLMGAWHRSTKLRWHDTAGHLNGKLDHPRVSSDGVVVADWDGSLRPESRDVLDVSGNSLHGKAVNMPMRAVTGHNYSGRETDFRTVPEEYGAIFFHDDDLEDARWLPDFELTVPDEMPSGVYAARLRSGETEDYIPFFVRPRRGTSTAKIAFLAPTYSYLAYGNEHISYHNPGSPVDHNIDDYLQKEDFFVTANHLLSLYDHHTDGTGNCYASRLRPLVVNFRPKYIAPLLKSPHQFNADLHLIDWLEVMGYKYDVLTDEDLHEEGISLIRPYRVVLTGSHHEYWTGRMIDSIEEYLDTGGRLMYLSGNGFYWPIGVDPSRPHIIEVRRGQNGTGTWRSSPGENHLSTTGEPGGLWRDRLRYPQKLVGVGMAAAGYDAALPYMREPGSFDPRVSFIFRDVPADGPIGEEGLVLNGAAGLELDRVDYRLGSPPHTLILATARGFSRSYQRAVEEVETTDDKQGGPDSPYVRADLAFFETPNDGAVFSTGSITWCGSLSSKNYGSSVSQITRNVLDAFAKDGPLPSD